jgi:hypothetical protein
MLIAIAPVYPSMAHAVPIDCLADEATPFIQQLRSGSDTPWARESSSLSTYDDLRKMAIDLAQHGNGLGPVPPDYAGEVADAAVACLPKARSVGDKEAAKALRYLAIAALAHVMTAATKDASARYVAADIALSIGLGDDRPEGSEIEATLATAIQVTSGRPHTLDRTGMAARVYRALAREMTPGQPLIEDYLNLVREPLRNTVATLTNAALALETVRSVTEDLIAKASDATGVQGREGELLSSTEQSQLADLRSQYNAIFGQEISTSPTAVPTTLLTFRSVLEKAGVSLDILKQQCFTRAGDGACSPYPSNLFYKEAYPPKTLAAFVPMSDMDEELRPLARSLLPYVPEADLNQKLGAIADSPVSGQPKDLSDDLLDRLLLKGSPQIHIVDWCGGVAAADLVGVEAGDFSVRLRESRRRLNEAAGSVPPDEGSLGGVCNLIKRVTHTLPNQGEGVQ